jgi:hypothetical protein
MDIVCYLKGSVDTVIDQFYSALKHGERKCRLPGPFTEGIHIDYLFQIMPSQLGAFEKHLTTNTYYRIKENGLRLRATSEYKCYKKIIYFAVAKICLVNIGIISSIITICFLAKNLVGKSLPTSLPTSLPPGILTDLTEKAWLQQYSNINTVPKVTEDLLLRALNPDTGSSCLIGPPGCGKTSAVSALANVFISGEQPNTRKLPVELQTMKILQLDVTYLGSQLGIIGNLEKMVAAIKSEYQKYSQCILFVDEAHTLADMGHHSTNRSTNILQMLKPDLATGALKVIFATTFDEYKFIEVDKALKRRVKPIQMPTPSQEDIEAIITNNLLTHTNKGIIFQIKRGAATAASNPAAAAPLGDNEELAALIKQRYNSLKGEQQQPSTITTILHEAVAQAKLKGETIVQSDAIQEAFDNLTSNGQDHNMSMYT